MIKSELQKQQDYIEKMEQQIHCFNCKHLFNQADSKIGNESLNVHQCPKCELFFHSGLAFFGGEQFWYPVRDMELLTKALVGENVN